MSPTPPAGEYTIRHLCTGRGPSLQNSTQLRSLSDETREKNAVGPASDAEQALLFNVDSWSDCADYAAPILTALTEEKHDNRDRNSLVPRRILPAKGADARRDSACARDLGNRSGFPLSSVTT